MDIVADFKSDWLEHMRQRLKEMRVKIKAKASADPHKLSHAYWNARFRLVPVQPRKVFIAAEFTCPVEHKAGLEALIERFEKGEDVSPWLSTTSKIGEFNDKLLNDWGIQHFHLGGTAKERNDDCLFARVVNDAVFFVHVLPHNRYTERDMVRRIHANWPQLLERFKVPDSVRPSGKDLDDEQVQTLRDKNVVTFMQMEDGTLYYPLGGGLMSSGLSAQVLINSDAAFHQLKACQAYIDEHLETLLGKVRQQGRTPGTPPRFKLIVEANHDLYALEVASVVAFPLGNIFPPRPTKPPIDFTQT